jgi:pimeloyl-ACP methyl ester carboxylesterase
MKQFTSSDGLAIAYQEWDAESGAASTLPPVVLHHGFIADTNLNWVVPGVVEALVRAGRRVLALDARGHGASEKPHESAFYGEDKMVRDLGQLFDLTGAERVDLAGYSMGGVVSLLTAVEDRRVRRLVAGGIGAGVMAAPEDSERSGLREGLAAALETSDPSSISHPVATRFRAFADRVGGDRAALAAHARAARMAGVTPARITAPTLIVVGSEDPLAVGVEALAAAIPHARLLQLAGDHLSVVWNPEFAPAIVEFLSQP